MSKCPRKIYRCRGPEEPNYFDMCRDCIIAGRRKAEAELAACQNKEEGYRLAAKDLQGGVDLLNEEVDELKAELAEEIKRSDAIATQRERLRKDKGKAEAVLAESNSWWRVCYTEAEREINRLKAELKDIKVELKKLRG
jgi:chromosome segregation ATPase